MDLNFAPLIRLPVVDIGPILINNQQFSECGKLEMKAMSCVEAYGLHQGKEKCADLIADFKECLFLGKQFKRVRAMRFVRYKKYYSGEREKLFVEGPNCTSF